MTDEALVIEMGVKEDTQGCAYDIRVSFDPFALPGSHCLVGRLRLIA